MSVLCSLLLTVFSHLKRFLRLGQDHSETIACRELILDRILLGRAVPRPLEMCEHESHNPLRARLERGRAQSQEARTRGTWSSLQKKMKNKEPE